MSTHDESTPPRTGVPVGVVAVVAHPGDLAAVEQLLAGMIPDTGLAWVVTLQGGAHPATVAEDAIRGARMPVRVAAEGMPLEPNRIHLLESTRGLGVVQATFRRVGDGPHAVLRSVANDQRDGAVAVVLGPTLPDAVAGIRAIKDHGGLVLAESGAGATLPAGLVDLAVPTDEMADHLAGYSRYLRGLSTRQRDELELSRPRILEVLHGASGHDFGGYKHGTLNRRILRRMVVLGVSSPMAYADRVADDPHEAERLFQDLLIGVTQFFRDPAAFDALNRLVVPQLFKERSRDDPIRVWVSGCASGEEAYSVAVLLVHHAESHPEPPPIQVFATDIDERALEIARQGQYPDPIADQVPKNLLHRYFTRTANGWRVRDAARSVCLFSSHNLQRVEVHRPRRPDHAPGRA